VPCGRGRSSFKCRQLEAIAVTFYAAGLNHPIEIYLKAAEDGFIAAQYLVGLAHLEGCGIEKNGHSAYYWLRMAEENSLEKTIS
jgi:TPR repeat protein